MGVAISALAIGAAAVAIMAPARTPDAQSIPASVISPQAAPALTQGLTRAGYVPDQQCAVCHRELYDSYQHVGMAKSFSRPRAEHAIEDFQGNHFHHKRSNRHYEILWRDDQLVMQRYQLDEVGDRINSYEQVIDWIIGSGAHSRGYLWQTELGELFELPVVWYTQTEQWGMAPGYDSPDHAGFTRQITRDCMFCHNAYPDVPPGSDRHDQPHLFPHELPQGTGCQRCHGPGAAHIRLANDLEATPDAVRDSVVNPARLPPQQRDDVCYQCHLQSSSKHTSFVRRFDQDTYSFVAGDDLAQYMVHLDFALDGDDAGESESDRFEINHHPYRLRQSTCFTASDGAINCLTCHDPHRKVSSEQASTHYRNACLTCHVMDDCTIEAMDDAQAADHNRAQTALDNCVACHMPKRRTQDVIHVVMTDHRIQRTPSADYLDPLEEVEPQPTTTHLYFPDRAPAEPEDALYRALAQVMDEDLTTLTDLEKAIAESKPQTTDPFFELGDARLRDDRIAQAARTFQYIISRDPESAAAFTHLGVAMHQAGQSRQAVAILSHALRLAPDTPETHYAIAAAYEHAGDGLTSIEHYRRAVELRPNFANAWFNLGNSYGRRGRFDEAAVAYRRVLAIEPNTIEAYYNLGVTLRYLDDWDQAIRIWKFGSSVAPEHVGIAIELSLAYSVASDQTLRNPVESLRLARVAVAQAEVETEAEPISKALLALALAQSDNDQPIPALETIERAGEIGADQITCLLVRAIAHHQDGDVELARAACQQAELLMADESILGPDYLRDALRNRVEVICE